MTEELTVAGRTAFPGISSRAFEHPADRAALTALRKVPGFDALLKPIIGLLRERSLRSLFLASAVRVGPRQFARLDAVYQDCLRILDVPERPELFVAQSPFVGTGAIGAERPFIVLSAGAVELLGEEEIRHVIGHDLAHILSGHVLFKTLHVLLNRFPTERLGIPLVGLARSAVMAALTEWDRKSELSCDRAGLLCGQDPALSNRVFMKLAGGPSVDQMDVDALLEQAEEYEGGDRLDALFKLINLLGMRHPLWVLRLAELKKWAESGAYETIMAGEYPRREGESAEPEEGPAEEAKDEPKDEPKDPLQTLREIGAQLVEGGGNLLNSLMARLARGSEVKPEPPDEDVGGDRPQD